MLENIDGTKERRWIPSPDTLVGIFGVGLDYTFLLFMEFPQRREGPSESAGTVLYCTL
jgi:hypothetical protein